MSPIISLWMTFWIFLINFNFFFTTPQSQNSNVWCLKVLSTSQNLQFSIPILYVKCPISILQNSWRLEILSKFPLFELDSKAALARLCFQFVIIVFVIIAITMQNAPENKFEKQKYSWDKNFCWVPFIHFVVVM